ncbi:DUF11 domain-containing protein [Marinobacterium rhizophilum]|uniref:DUF11 domain-containing protein n=1 Tax=Marinobacterium rhizophilum TaxID=420402 RepID=A0ABY5HQE3_9GAMM|nr:DUF11 domain-containing protein [Marinobacterium rhizophilum]UTW13429.1 DUF11 domain-containing protein [Marinobacterium rhizophilum]
MKRLTDLQGCLQRTTRTALQALLILGLLAGTQTAQADGAGNADVLNGQACMEDTADFGLNCTANDVRIANATNIVIDDDGCAFPGDTVDFTATFTVELTAQARHDIGIWFAEDGDPNGDGALTGTCTAATPAYAPDPPWLDLDGTLDPFPGPGKKEPSGVQDTCGDIDAAHNPLFPVVTLTNVACVDSDGDGKLNLPNCTSWRQPGANELCEGPLDAYPGSPSKCRCDDGFNIDIDVPNKFIEVVKSLDPVNDPGRFNLLIDNIIEKANAAHNDTTGVVDVETAGTHVVSETAGTGTPDLTTFYDTDIECVERGTTNVAASCTDCTSLNVDVPETGADYVCTISNTLILAAPVLTLTKTNDADQDGVFNDTENVPGEAVYPYTVVYHALIENDSISDAQITSLVDSPHNDFLSGPASTCDELVNQPAGIIPAGGSVECTFEVPFDNADQASVINTLLVEAQAVGDPSQVDTAQDTSTVNFGQNPDIDIVKDGALDLDGDGIANPGDLIHYTLTVTNTGNATLSGAALTDALPGVSIGSLSDNAGNGIDVLAPGDVETAFATYAITQDDIDAGLVENLAEVCADPPIGPPVCDDDPHDEPIPQTPAIDIVKDGALDLGANGVANPGDLIHYTLTVTNTGNATLSGAALTDALPGVSIGSLSDNAGNGIDVLAPGDVETAFATYAITQDDIDAGLVENLAEVCADPPIGPPVCDDDPHDEPIPQTPAIDIVKDGALDLGANGVANPGDLIHYTLTVTNTGNATLSGAALTDALPGVSIGSLSDNAGNGIDVLAPGDVETAFATYAITQDDIDAGLVENLAEVCADPPIGPPVCDDDPHDEPIPQTPAIDIVKDGALDLGANGVANPGDLIHYTLTVTNTGNATLSGAALTDALPGVSIGSLSDNAGNGIDVLAPGDVETAFATYAITQDDIDAGLVENLAEVCADPPIGPPVCDDDPHDEPIPQTPAIDIVKDGALDLDGDGIANPGDLIHYTLTVTNTGNLTLSGAALTDALPGVSIGSLSDAAGNGIDVLAPGDVETAFATYAITQDDIDAGLVENLAEVCADPPIGPPVCDDDPHDEPIPQTPAIDIVKDGTFQDENGDGFAQVGETIAYSFKVSNIGNVTLNGVNVTDPLPGLSAISCPNGNPIPSLAPTAMETCSASYSLAQTDIDLGQVDNLATACGTSPTGAEVCDDDPETVQVPPPPAVGFLIIDEDSIDNNHYWWDDGVIPSQNNDNEFSAWDVNDDKAAEGLRDILRFFDVNVGWTIQLFTGQVGDEGWFAPQFIPNNWNSHDPDGNGLHAYIDGLVPQNKLDKVRNVTPLRSTGLHGLEGGDYCAVVYDSDVSINYGPLNGNLQGANYGIVAFHVLIDGVKKANGFSSSTLPTVTITILDAELTCSAAQILTDVPKPPTSSEPFDIDPENPTGGYQ